MDRQKKVNKKQASLILRNSFFASLIIAYGWICLKFDCFYIPARSRGDLSLHGFACLVMVLALWCIALALIVHVIKFYLSGWQKLVFAKAAEILPYIFLGLFCLALFWGCVNKNSISH